MLTLTTYIYMTCAVTLVLLIQVKLHKINVPVFNRSAVTYKIVVSCSFLWYFLL